MTELWDRKIIHLDLDAFFCAVEELRDPTLRGKPFAVGGRPEDRGVVASCSYPARIYGVHSAMPTAQALQLCPQMTLIPGRHDTYRTYSRRVIEQLHNFTHLVEQISIDEAFLDVSDLRPAALDLAREVQAAIWQKLELPASLGVATNKLVAKIANTVGKRRADKEGPPMAIQVVAPGEEAAFLAPLDVRELWGVGPKTAETLETLGITTIGALAQWPAQDLARRFGKHGEDLARRARGLDDRPISPERETKSISHETTFPRDVTDEVELKRTLYRLAEDVGRRLRRAGLAGTTIKLKLRWSDFTTLTRQTTLPQPTDRDAEIHEAAQNLFETHWPSGKPVRLIGVGIENLAPPARQLGLWDTTDRKDQRLQETVDALRNRYGRNVLRRAIEIDPE